MIGLCVCAFFSTSCQRIINPKLESRLFFPDEVKCKIIGPIELKNYKCELYVEGVGSLEDFLLIGHSRFVEDQELLELCEKKGLVQRKK